MDPRNYASFAGYLANMISAGPERYRSSISRSYYAAFLVARDFIGKAGLQPKGGPQQHSGVKQGLLNSKDSSIKAIGISLDTLHDQRKRADYDMADNSTEAQSQARAVYSQAARLISELDQISNSVSFPAIARALQTWAQTPAGANWLQPI